MRWRQSRQLAPPALQLLLREVHRTAPRLVVPATLMVVVAVVVAADLIREDAGLLAAVLLGMVVANQRSIDVSRSLIEFEETLVQLLVGVLFVLVAASVSPGQVRSVMPEALGLVAVMVLFIRPAAVGLTTLGSSFTDHTVQGLIDAVLKANHAVWQLARDNPDLQGMATIGNTTHTNTRVMPSAGEPINWFFTHKG